MVGYKSILQQQSLISNEVCLQTKRIGLKENEIQIKSIHFSVCQFRVRFLTKPETRRVSEISGIQQLE